MLHWHWFVPIVEFGDHHQHVDDEHHRPDSARPYTRNWGIGLHLIGAASQSFARTAADDSWIIWSSACLTRAWRIRWINQSCLTRMGAFSSARSRWDRWIAPQAQL